MPGALHNLVITAAAKTFCVQFSQYITFMMMTRDRWVIGSRDLSIANQLSSGLLALPRQELRLVRLGRQCAAAALHFHDITAI